MSSVIYVFIDASNLWEAQKAKGFLLDFEKLRNYLEDFYHAGTIEVFFYTAYPAEGTRSYSLDGKFKFYVYLQKKLGFIVRKKPLKQIHNGNVANPDGMTEKGNMDVEMTIDAVDRINEYDTAILFSGDSDFLELITYMKSKGKKTYVYSSRNNVSSELRTGADGYTDVLKITDDIWGRPLIYRNQRTSENNP